MAEIEVSHNPLMINMSLILFWFFAHRVTASSIHLNNSKASWKDFDSVTRYAILPGRHPYTGPLFCAHLFIQVQNAKININQALLELLLLPGNPTVFTAERMLNNSLSSPRSLSRSSLAPLIHFTFAPPRPNLLPMTIPTQPFVNKVSLPHQQLCEEVNASVGM